MTEIEESTITQPLRGRPSKINYELVERIASNLAATKGHFTCNDVLSEIGEGSMATVHPLVKKWRDQNPVAHSKAIEPSAKFLAALGAEIARQIDATLQVYKDDLSVARTDNDHLCNALERQQEQLADIEQAVSTTSSALAEKNAALHALRDERADLKADIKRLETASWLNREKLLLSESKSQNVERMQSEIATLSSTLEKFQEQVIFLRAELAASKATAEQLKERLIELRPTQVSKPETKSNIANLITRPAASTVYENEGSFPTTEGQPENTGGSTTQASQVATTGNLDASLSATNSSNDTQQPKLRGKRLIPTQKDRIINAAAKCSNAHR